MSRLAARGLSLIELMVALAISLTLSLAITTFLFQGTRSSQGDVNIASMLDELSYAASLVSLDLEMAGFWAHVHDPSAIELDGTLDLEGADCGSLSGWYKNDLTALAMLDNNTGDLSAYPCLNAADVVPGTDVVAIKRVRGRAAGTNLVTSGMQSGLIYLRTHEKFGRLYLEGGAPATMPAPYSNWQYVPAVYFVRRWSDSAGEVPRVPSLCRMVLQAQGAKPRFVSECVARGVENLQLEIGVDTDDDGTVNFFTASPNPITDLNRAITARVYLQVRSTRPDFHYFNAKSYQIGNTADPFGGDDEVHFFRKTLSTEVALRNPRGLIGVAVQ